MHDRGTVSSLEWMGNPHAVRPVIFSQRPKMTDGKYRRPKTATPVEIVSGPHKTNCGVLMELRTECGKQVYDQKRYLEEK